MLDVNEMGLSLVGSGFRLVLCIGIFSAWWQSSGNLEVLYDC